MTEAAQEAAPKKRRSRAKDNSANIMKELGGLMQQRTDLLGKMRTKRLEVAAKQAEFAELESSLQALGTEIQWRASIFNLAVAPDGQPTSQPAPMMFPGAPTQALTPPIFRQPELPQSRDGVNRGYADLSSLS